MGFFNRLKTNAIVARKTEEILYASVAEEMAANELNSALWLKALEKSNGNEERRTSEYIKLRIQSLKDDSHIMSEISKALAEEAVNKNKAHLANISLQEIERERVEAELNLVAEEEAKAQAEVAKEDAKAQVDSVEVQRIQKIKNNPHRACPRCKRVYTLSEIYCVCGDQLESQPVIDPVKSSL